MRDPGGPFEPHTGSGHLYSDIADVSFKRLTKTVAVPGGGHQKFWAAYGTAESCASGWRELHPQLDHHQTFNGDACTPTGTTGGW
ncbi:hypothetical protein [Candidatus Solirubrobacter pratensis]|uniref:hypothetical protein n=1 Tax=Candidatus Solirubrobacter pratensis TaxID=1298857 RepID=UPI000404B314|nr:hypothetical protein [Candidatus Solirubrobacter pratensis]